MDLNLAIRYGQLVNAAYAINSSDLGNKAGQIVTAGLGAASGGFSAR